MGSLIPIRDKGEWKQRQVPSMLEECRNLWAILSTHFRTSAPTSMMIGFVSTIAGEGTTTLASNFAVALGEQGITTCLVEGNFHNPGLAGSFDVPPEPGLLQALRGKVDPSLAVHRQVAEGLDLLPAGGSGVDSYPLLGGNAFLQALVRLRDGHNAIVLDAPPLSEHAEASLMLRYMDAVILVVRANEIRKPALRRSLTTLKSLGVPYVGVTLNAMTYELPVFLDRLL
ncbi:MAG: CpsD/CapB family tyrosine-protein kinase [Planctomycetota bacterium]